MLIGYDLFFNKSRVVVLVSKELLVKFLLTTILLFWICLVFWIC